ncbi:MAG: hypothetical protein KJP21_06045 [Bacteroidia bacterium]|nr:hypothetical protein [Bacteroidia bacterium]
MIGFVEGADVYLIIALLIFLMVFILAAVYMFSLSKQQCTELSNLPFQSSNNENNEE